MVASPVQSQVLGEAVHLPAAAKSAVQGAQALVDGKLDGHVWHVLQQRRQEALSRKQGPNETTACVA